MKQQQKMPAMTRLFSPAVLALALLCWGSTALATVTPIQGTPVGLEGDPEGIKFNTKTDVDGKYIFTGLKPGKYKLNIPGLPTKTIIIGKDGKFTGVVQKPVEKGVSGTSMYNGDVSITTDAEVTFKKPTGK